RHAACHLRDVLRRVELVAVDELPAEVARERAAHRRLSRAGDAHDDDDARRGHDRFVSRTRTRGESRDHASRIGSKPLTGRRLPGDTARMDLSFSKEDEAYRQEVRAWLRKNLPKRETDAEGGERTLDDPRRIANAKAWQRKMYDAGYVATGWPEEYGGHGASILRQSILNEELVLAKAPTLIGMMGIQMLGPTLIRTGTDEQRKRFLPKILTAEELWCQGYSEPGSGSDLASLKTRAELDGDFFVVNGQKVWTSTAQFADWMFCLVRTDPSAPKHK